MLQLKSEKKPSRISSLPRKEPSKKLSVIPAQSRNLRANSPANPAVSNIIPPLRKPLQTFLEGPASGNLRAKSPAITAYPRKDEYNAHLDRLRAELEKGYEDHRQGRFIELNSREEIAAFFADISRRGRERLAKERKVTPNSAEQ